MAKAPAKKPAPRKGASRNSKASQHRGVPGWLWLLLGLAVGIFVAFLWHLWELRKDGATTVAVVAVATPEQKHKEISNTPASKANGAGEEPRFDFYTLLPNQQAIPNKSPGSKTVTPATPAPPVTSTVSAGKTTGGLKEHAYILQAGSFKNEAEADKRRASILLLGLPVKIQKVPVKPGETWFRVVVGPIKGKDAVQSARASLRGNGVDTLVLPQG